MGPKRALGLYMGVLNWRRAIPHEACGRLTEWFGSLDDAPAGTIQTKEKLIAGRPLGILHTDHWNKGKKQYGIRIPCVPLLDYGCT